MNTTSVDVSYLAKAAKFSPPQASEAGAISKVTWTGECRWQQLAVNRLRVTAANHLVLSVDGADGPLRTFEMWRGDTFEIVADGFVCPLCRGRSL